MLPAETEAKLYLIRTLYTLGILTWEEMDDYMISIMVSDIDDFI